MQNANDNMAKEIKELTLRKEDNDRINRDANNLVDRIQAEASEYAHLYEITYYQRVIDYLRCKIDAVNYVHETMKQ